MTALVATDLDQTLIYSRRAIERWGETGGPLTSVEVYQGENSSFMTAAAAAGLCDLASRTLIVPVTTRTEEQLARVRLPGASRYAVAANGGVLLVDGAPDAAWRASVAARVATAAPLSEIERHALEVCRPKWTKLVRTASDLFCYAVLDRDAMPAGLVEREARWADPRGWRVSLQGRKLYWVPQALTKRAAVAEVARRSGCARVLAAGDSLLDLDLLAGADAGIAARHGELVASGWSAPHVAVTSAEGVAAGEQIVGWFADQLGS